MEKERNKENTGRLIKPIGIVRSGYREPSLTFQDEDLQLNREVLTRTRTNKGGISELVIKEEYKDCLDGIEDFSHIMVLYWSHLIDDEQRYVTKVHPAGKKEYPLVGVFATRSPVRPNPICVTTVELLGRKENVLKVKSLDALDGSPVIDIKFHHPSYDAPPNVKWPDWMGKLMGYFREELSKTKKGGYTKNKKEIIETAYKKGYKYEQESTCCSQCIVAALQDSIEFAPKDEDIFRAASGLCGGMGPSEDGNCGAFIGSGMILSLLFGRRREEFEDRGKTDYSRQLVNEVYERFQEEYGSSICKEVRKQMEKYEDRCPRIVGKAAAWTAEIVLRESAKWSQGGSRR